VREAIRNKRKCYRNLGKCKSSENFEEYKVTRREVKEAVRKAGSIIFKDLHGRWILEMERKIYIDLLVSRRRRLETSV
jgi:hypothetical protein